MAVTGRMSEQFMLRLPSGMRDRLKDLAEKNRRSMNSEIVVILENAVVNPANAKKGTEAAA